MSNSASEATVLAKRETIDPEMKIMLQHKRTGHYVAEGGNWTVDPNRAQVFSGLEGARQYGVGHSFRDLRIIALAGRESARREPLLKKEAA